MSAPGRQRGEQSWRIAPGAPRGEVKVRYEVRSRRYAGATAEATARALLRLIDLQGAKTMRCSTMLLASVLTLALMLPSQAQVPQFEIELNNTPSPDDDYLCWTPVQARIRMVGGGQPVSVVLNSRSREDGGEVALQADQGGRPTSADFAPKANITLTLSEDESWTLFWVAGSKASTEGKDTEVVVSQLQDGVELASIPLTVRVRKDASTLTPTEISRFLNALSSHHNMGNQAIASKYKKYAKAHEKASWLGIHGSHQEPYPPLFLAWHRALLLSIERELQTIDPTVSIPYWRFDRDDDADQPLFSVDFMGTISGGDPVAGVGTAVQFSQQNPLNGWVAGDGGPLARKRDGTKAFISSGRLEGLLEAEDAFGDLIHTTYRDISEKLELGYHNRAHDRIGGQLRQTASPGDPLFFLLHANVDRAWALWQQADPAIRFDPTHVDAYPAQGSYPGVQTDGEVPFRMGSYADDPMWPWGGYSGDQDNEDTEDDWPDMRFDMPAGPGVGGSSSRPSPAAMIDYLDVRGTGRGTGTCYDHLSF